MSRDVFLVDGLRSPIGKFGASLKPLRATEFGSTVAAALLDRVNLEPEALDLIIGGMVLQDMTESNPARIVVLINSPLKHVGDLRDQTLGLPPARSLVNVIIRVDLDERGLWAGRDFQARHFPSTPACLHNLLVNRVDACATGGGAGLRSFERKMGVKLRTLYQTQPFPHMLFITRPDFPADEANKLKQFILGLGESAEGRELLRQIGPDSRFVPYRPADYDVIRRYHKTMQRHAQILP